MRPMENNTTYYQINFYDKGIIKDSVKFYSDAAGKYRQLVSNPNWIYDSEVPEYVVV